MKINPCLVRFSRVAAFLALVSAVNFQTPTLAQQGPAIIAVSPANGAMGVAASTPVVFTFSEAMDTAATMASIIETTGTFVTTSATWNSAGTVLTCTPTTAFPTPATITWYVSGQDVAGNMLQGIPAGSFKTGTNSGCSPPPATNTSFQLLYFWTYVQTDTNSPPAPLNPPDYAFSVSAIVTLASNVTANSIGVMLPSGGVSNLIDTLGDPLSFDGGDGATNNNTLDYTWTNGTYTFDVAGVSPKGALPTNVALDFDLSQPNAPEIVNFAEAQAVNPGKAFTLQWKPFTNAAEGSEIIVSIAYSNCPVASGFETNLAGSATSVTIPAHTLDANQIYTNNEARILFISRVVTPHSDPDYQTVASRGTITYFPLITTNATSAPAPTIVAQPTNTTVKVGATATFDVSATGTGTLTYQWQFNGTNLPHGGEISGTIVALKIINVKAANQGSYSVIVTDSTGSTTSEAAVLTVEVPPSIVTQPKSQVVAVGTEVNLSVAATGTAPLSYQWKRNGVKLTDTATSTGAASATLTINDVATANAGIYTVTVTDAVGSVTSAKATLTVDVPPSITTQPANRSVPAGKTAVFTVKATGTAPLSYHWSLNGKTLANGAGISGATTPTLTITKAKASNEGAYTVVVTNAVGSVTSSSATLSVSP